ncbi:DUF3179 domain-containing (seleno)protein [Paraflavitalea sp. CAU 1676]|uniref:DUF3179 domain-containing (seleno)protein n=1 Tax=Paraflavitalea sp. CAU 1676 TaxID=3032598 RepID=UPI0023DB2E18|nr:DUF3179 domain-containing (seleno)protein [Paraflavitalea sp. CAU 1676]MDF2189114.1 DUF3179 domain-containing (seleno)protein [Paraflavitalea sp. CAU 1676]
MKQLLLVTGLLLLFTAEILRVYYIMPFPGSQQSNTIDLAYWLHNNIYWVRILGLLLIAYPVVQVFKQTGAWKKVLLVVVLALYATVFYFFNYRFLADKMFYQPGTTAFAPAASNKVAADRLVIGVVADGVAKAYPIQLIGYHHQVRDTIGHLPVMVTYCTVCRTGRVFSPIVDGHPETFRLVGMDHFNAMFEDATTKSWWRQVSGEAIAGPLKGKKLTEIPSTQMTLAAWLQQYPGSLVFQPDTTFNKQYDHLALFDKGTIESGLEKREPAAWKMKSWVVGVEQGDQAKAYDWTDLTRKQLIEDSLPGMPILLTLDSDTASFHVLKRSVNGTTLQFKKDNGVDSLTDVNTQSRWTTSGLSVGGPLKGTQLERVQAYQEFWHSWRTFHPGTLQYRAAK